MGNSIAKEPKSREVAIQLSGVKKMYRLGQIGGGTLQGDLQSWGAKIHGKEDPNSKIGQKQRIAGTRFMALNGIDLTVYKGEALGIIGVNGAGKSTLLKLLSRVTAPTEGEIDIYGRITSMLEVGTGFNGEMTGRENVYMNGTILGMSKAEIDAKMEEIIEFSEVREFIDTPVKRYSSGMYVKLAFAVAAHLDSEIMVMDEVLAVGDMKFQKKCLSRMDQASSTEGKTVLYVSHNMNTIRQLCTRCIVLDQGKIVFDGDPDQAISIYMDSVASVDQLSYDLSKKRLKYLSPLIKAKMIHITIEEKERASFSVGEEIRFALKIQARKYIPSASLRFEIRSADEGPVGTAFALGFSALEKDAVKTFHMSFKTGDMVPGKYYVVLGLFEVNEMGAYDDLDVVENALGFEIVDTQNVVKINWLPGFWGKIKFSDLEIR